MNDLITVVIPVYNVEKYLKRCVNSILKQTYKNIEIILVDDGSEDNCGHICNEYKDEDKRVKVIHKKNGGLSDARNAGIDIATGRYITFVDSDDDIAEDYVEHMYNMIVEENTDMAISEVQKVFKDKDFQIPETNEIERKIFNVEQCLYNMLFAKRGDVCAYAKLYDITLFEDIRYPKGEVYEDSATTYKIIDKCNKISYSSKKCYYYYTRPGSISKQGQFNKNEEDYIKNTKEMLTYINNKYPQLDKAVIRYDLYSKFRILRMLLFTKPRNKEYENELIKQIKLQQKTVLGEKDTPKRDRIAIYTLKLGKNFFKLTWYLYSKLTGRIL